MPFVVIRLRSNPQVSDEHCIQLSNPSTNTLSVYNSKTQQDFTFDMIATETTTQFSMFTSVVGSFMDTIEKGLTTSRYRMDHLVMGYGQSGSGKSYTIFGEKKEEGLLPRLIDKLNEQGYQLGLRAFEIYNEQIYDLLVKHNKQKQRVSISKRQIQKPIEIKEDLKQGVHVQGLELIEVPKFSSSINLVSDILTYSYAAQPSHDDRKSHKIMTLVIKHEKYHSHKEIKLHFVQLASCDGQREYFTRRPSISINKSLSNLNTILSNLMDLSNGKPKKHIPFRQSKLTFYLKDMLSASGSNKWIFTNIFVQRGKLSQSINSLMFAKRAKCLPEQFGEKDLEASMDGEKTARKNTRQEVKMLRQELQNSRFIHGKNIDTQWQCNQEQSREQRSFTRSPLKMINLSPLKSRQIQIQRDRNKDIKMVLSRHKVSNNLQQINTLIQNETQFRDIIKLYQERIGYLQNKQNKNQIVKGIYNEKRLLQNLNHKYAKLVLNFPTFANIISENNELKEELNQTKQELEARNNQILQLHHSKPEAISHNTTKLVDTQLLKSKVLGQEHILVQYQKLIQKLQAQVRKCADELKKAYQVDMCKQKESQGYDKMIFAIKNQNDCLKLTILTQQEEIQRLHQEYSFVSLEIKAITQENRFITSKNKQLEDIVSKGNFQEHGLDALIEKLVQIKEAAEKDAEELERLNLVNKQLQAKIEQSANANFNSVAKNKLNTSIKQTNNDTTRTNRLQNQIRNLRKQIKQNDDKKLLLQKQLSKLSCKVAELNRELSLSKETELSLFQELTNSNQKIKLLQTKQKVQNEKFKQFTLDIAKVKKELQLYSDRSKLIKQQFNRSEIQIIQDYRDLISNKRLSMARKGRSELESYLTCRSNKPSESAKCLNTTMIVSCEKLSTIVEPPRLSSGKKLICKESREFKKQKQRQKEKDIKPFMFKAKQIKNSIIQKP